MMRLYIPHPKTKLSHTYVDLETFIFLSDQLFISFLCEFLCPKVDSRANIYLYLYRSLVIG